MAPILGMLGGVASNLIGGAIQSHQQKGLTAQQVAASKELTEFNREQQMKLWEDTNYSAQVGQMQKAGINPGLLYGMGGGGGATTNLATGSAQGATAQNNGMGMIQGAQLDLLKAQKDNIEADTENKKASAGETIAKTPTHAKNIEKTDSEIQEIATKIGVNIETAKKILQDVKQSQAQTTNIEAGTEKTKAETGRINTMTPKEAAMMDEMIKSQITRNVYLNAKERAELNKLTQEIIEIEARVEQTDEKIDLEVTKQQLEAKYPGLFQVAGGVINQILTRLTGGTDDNYIHPTPRRRE